MAQSAGSDLPPWQRNTDEANPGGQAASSESGSASPASPAPSAAPNLENLASLQTRPAAHPQNESEELSGLEQLFYKDDFFRTVLIGCAGGFGLSTLVILISLELTTLRAAMSNNLGLWWFLVPAFTVIGFSAWSFMLIRIRRHRYTKMLRKEAFEKHRSGSSEDGPSRDAQEESEHDPSQDDWL